MADHLDWGQLVDGLPKIPTSLPQKLQFQHRIRAYYKHLNRAQAFCHFSIGGRTFSLQEFLENASQLQELERLLEMEIELDFAGERITRPLLHHLVRTQDEVLETLLRKGMHGAFLTNTHESLLHVACECGSVRIVRTLLERHPELARMNTQEGISPLHWLFMFEEAELRRIGEELGGHGASINRVGVRFLTEFNLVFSGPPLHWAIMARNMSAVKVLIDLGADVNLSTPAPRDCLEYSGFSIDVATCLLMSEIVELLISRGAQVYHTPDGPGMSALHYIGETVDPFRLWLYHGSHVREAAKETMKVLLRNGAKLEAVDDSDPAPLQWIVNRTTCITLVLETFLTYKPPLSENILYSAAFALQHDRFNSGKMALLLEYCSRRLDSESFTRECMNALRICVKDGTVGAVKEIISRHSVDAKDIIHEEELVHAAAENDHAEMIDILLGYGADIDLDRDGTAAAVACRFSKRKALGFLLSRGASILSHPSERSSTTLLHHIVTNRTSPHESERTLRFVCDKFSEKFAPLVDNYDDKGFTALHRAIIWGNINNINHLMADLNASGLPIRGTDVSPTTLAALCRKRPPWQIFQQGDDHQKVYKRQLSFIIDYLVETMRLDPPNRAIENHNVEEYWTTPVESQWSPNEQRSDWYIKPEYSDTKVERTASNWWGVRWRAQSSTTEALDTAGD